ncbi:class I SAM-dependent methyltransferase [Streptomyces sp. TRM70308]|uniref:class I SAM-dependent methyltransferase n=1 Tax=Streptomyces TaxID=1883 RepID=UPI0022495DC9|nr:class I SAM-dependent methyltransferase [Streptomyces sp. JHD 1]MCX2968954.1 class I SAM-dependent methyltransferase [Streptomyces sp. JHD 1]
MYPHPTGSIDGQDRPDQRERAAELHLPALEAAVDWLRNLLRTADGRDGAVRRVLDVGGATGTATCLLARFFPNAEVVAVDRCAERLTRVAARAGREHLGTRVRTHRVGQPFQVAPLADADVIWGGDVTQHAGDQQAALDRLAAALRPGGLLAVVEPGLAPRFLPREIGMGRPGLQARLDCAVDDELAAQRARLPGCTTVVEDWPALLARAGLVPTGSRTFLVDVPAPLDLPAREYLYDHLTWLRDQVGGRLDPADRETLNHLLDGDACTGILWRPDAFYLAALTVHTARTCRRA